MNKKIFIPVLAGLFIFSAFETIHAQKKNVQNAYNFFKKVSPRNGMDKNLTNLNEAKKFIDLAATNVETQNDEKMHYYRGMIYMGLLEMQAMKQAQSGEMDKVMLEGYQNTIKESFKISIMPKARYKDDVEKLINSKSAQVFKMAVNAYNEKAFEMALGMFLQVSQISSLIGQDAKDADRNALICLNQVVNKLTTGDTTNFDMAIDLTKGVKELMPKEIDVLITLINIYVRNNDLEGAGKFMSEALELDPENKTLHYNLGTAYMSQKENEKAEASFRKAIELDPKYADAQYQLGAHLYNWAGDAKTEAGKLDYRDPKAEELENKANELLNRALLVLEKYITGNPNDKAVLGILKNTYGQLGNTEKWKEYKERLEKL
ncbi:MAG: tetratricopeptide repeat protein [Crocinitomicaceae bacterium]|nr:tetratricopeptide repeat protein [Crocinitomicaceae bacterium]